MSHVPLATSAPSWTLAVSLWSHLTLSSHKSLSHLQPRGQLLGCPCCCFLRPSSTRPILFLAPPHSGTFVSLGLATVSRWEQELLRGPWSFPGSPCGMQGNVSCGRPACPAWPPASSHCFPSPIQARGWEQDQNKVGTPAMLGPSLGLYSHNVTHHSSGPGCAIKVSGSREIRDLEEGARQSEHWRGEGSTGISYSQHSILTMHQYFG